MENNSRFLQNYLTFLLEKFPSKLEKSNFKIRALIDFETII